MFVTREEKNEREFACEFEEEKRREEIDEMRRTSQWGKVERIDPSFLVEDKLNKNK